MEEESEEDEQTAVLHTPVDLTLYGSYFIPCYVPPQQYTLILNVGSITLSRHAPSASSHDGLLAAGTGNSAPRNVPRRWRRKLRKTSRQQCCTHQWTLLCMGAISYLDMCHPSSTSSYVTRVT